MLTSRFEEAFVLACELHRTQTRKGGGAPYVSHLLAVSALVIEHGGDEDEAIAAFLHDAVEDQGGRATRMEIARRFGEAVARIVDGCTDAEGEPKPPWRERKRAFIENLVRAPAAVRRVTAADKLHNALCTIEDLRREGRPAWERFRGRERALWYYRGVLDALTEDPEPALVARLRRAVEQLEAF